MAHLCKFFDDVDFISVFQSLSHPLKPSTTLSSSLNPHRTSSAQAFLSIDIRYRHIQISH